MSTATSGYAAQSATTSVEPWEFERRDPRPDDVSIDILYCGVCHTDIHQTRNGWGWSTYPMVPGHEIIGRVSGVGPDVTGFKPGDIVGVGTLVDSCRHCASCRAGLEVYCEEFPTSTYGAKDRRDGTPTQGGYADKIIVSDRFVLHIRTRSTPRPPGRCSARASPPTRP